MDIAKNRDFLLKEIDIKYKKRIGDGAHGDVYPINSIPNTIVKKSNTPKGFSDDEMTIYSYFNSNPNLFPKIYKINKNFIIMEKLEVNYQSKYFKNIMDVITDYDYSPYLEKDLVKIIYKNIKENNFEDYENFINKGKEYNNKQCIETIQNIKSTLLGIINLFPNKSLDIHESNGGFTKEGYFKMFDLSID